MPDPQLTAIGVPNFSSFLILYLICYKIRKNKGVFMNIRQLASAIAKAEAGKSNVKIGDVREILRVIADLAVHDPEVIVALVRYANRRARV
jgi:hypothetical protein